MEDKPVTALVLFQPLPLVPFNYLPNKFTNKLAEVKQRQKWAIDKLRASLVPACITSVFAVGFAFLTVYTLFMGASVLPYLLSAFAFVGFSFGSFFSVRGHKRDVDAYRQITISPQLQIGAGNEFAASQMADTVNKAVVIWNKRLQGVPPEGVDERHVLALKKERKIIISKLKETVEAIEDIKSDYLDPEE